MLGKRQYICGYFSLFCCFSSRPVTVMSSAFLLRHQCHPFNVDRSEKRLGRAVNVPPFHPVGLAEFYYALSMPNAMDNHGREQTG